MPPNEKKILPKATFDRLKAACQDIMLWELIDPDVWREFECVPDSEFWESNWDRGVSDDA